MTEAIIAVCSLLLGYGLSQLQALLERERQTTNLRRILAKELRDNYRVLCRLTSEGQKPSLRELLTAAELHRFLSRRVIDAYLDRLSELAPSEFEAVYNAHTLVDRVRDAAVDLAEIVSELAATDPAWQGPYPAGLSHDAIEVLDKARWRMLNNSDGASKTVQVALAEVGSRVPSPEEIWQPAVVREWTGQVHG